MDYKLPANPDNDDWFQAAGLERARRRQPEGDPALLSGAALVEQFEKLAAESTRRKLDEAADRDLEQWFTTWDDVPHDEARGLESLLVEPKVDERAMLRYLKAHPRLLVQHLSGGHGRWVIPHRKLGKFEADFMIAEKSSLGFEWTAVELEHPNARMFVNNGDASSELQHAIRQINDWRAAIQSDMRQADAPVSDGGWGLRDVEARTPGLIIIGRRVVDEPRELKRRRRAMCEANRIAIRSYDWLLDLALQKAEQHAKRLVLEAALARPTGDSDSS